MLLLHLHSQFKKDIINVYNYVSTFNHLVPEVTRDKQVNMEDSLILLPQSRAELYRFV